MKLSKYAKKIGISYWTAFRWFKAGQLPVPAFQTKSGTIIVEDVEEKHDKIALYARVSSSDQKTDLDRQVSRLASWASEQGMVVSATVAEVGSGLNGKRRKLLRLLRDSTVTTIVVEHRERLARFGFEMVASAMEARGGRLVVIDPTEVEDDLVRDMTELLTSLCARLYGKRSAKRRAKKAVEATRVGK
jgi:putative resolvase